MPTLTASPFLTTTATTNTGGIYYSNNQLWYNNQVYVDTTTNETNPLKNLPFNFLFDIDDENDILVNSIKGVEKNKLIFNCEYLGNNIQPYEFIMELINDKKKFTLEINVSDILTIKYFNCQFTKIENNLKINGIGCDFSELKVKFKYDKILYENNRLSLKELRKEKLEKLKKINI